MMRRLKSVFRDEKNFFSRKNFFEIFENFFQLISLKLTLLFQYWIKLFLYRLFECIISKKKIWKLWSQTSLWRSFFDVQQSESQRVTFDLAQLRDLFWPHFQFFCPIWNQSLNKDFRRKFFHTPSRRVVCEICENGKKNRTRIKCSRCKKYICSAHYEKLTHIVCVKCKK